jgi:hypothetical protein
VELLPKNSTENDIINLIGEFVNLLAEEKYVEAFELTYHTFDHMSPGWIKKLIEGYGIDEPADEVFRVTSLEKMKNQSPRIYFYWYDSIDDDEISREIGCVEYFLPINGEWSDLMATFYVHELESGVALSIYNIHVP